LSRLFPREGADILFHFFFSSITKFLLLPSFSLSPFPNRERSSQRHPSCARVRNRRSGFSSKHPFLLVTLKRPLFPFLVPFDCTFLGQQLPFFAQVGPPPVHLVVVAQTLFFRFPFLSFLSPVGLSGFVRYLCLRIPRSLRLFLGHFRLATRLRRVYAFVFLPRPDNRPTQRVCHPYPSELIEFCFPRVHS